MGGYFLHDNDLSENHLGHITLNFSVVNLTPLTDMGGQLFKIATVGIGQDQLHDANPSCRDHLLANTAHGEDITGKGQLAGHRQRTINILATGKLE